MMKTIQSVNPSTLEVLGQLQSASLEEVDSIVAKANLAQKNWFDLGFDGRKKFLLAFRDEVLNQIDNLAELIAKENGKPKLEAIGNDILPALDLITHFAKSSHKILRKQKISLGKWGFMGRKSYLEYYPYGVVGIISPWNFPFSIPVGEIAMALMAGNTVVLKPSEHTPLISQAIADIFKNIQMPSGVFNLILGDGEIGAKLIASNIQKVMFTGSVATGKIIMKACSEKLLPLTLELGGKDPLAVFADADLEAASSAAVWGAFCNSGQVCASVERVYVEESIAQKFTEMVVQKTKAIQQGDPLDFKNDMGAMTLLSQLKKVEHQIDDAKTRGAKIECGGKRLSQNKGYFFEPTVLTEVNDDFDVVREETFGPVLPILKFSTEDELIHKMNHSEYALNAYVWTKNRERARRVASQIIAGTVNINESLFTHALPQTPWGGVKASGIGRTHGAMGLMDLVRVRHVHINKRPKLKNFFWWYGYSEDKIVLMKTLANGLFGRGFSRVKSLVKFVGMVLKVRVR